MVLRGRLKRKLEVGGWPRLEWRSGRIRDCLSLFEVHPLFLVFRNAEVAWDCLKMRVMCEETTFPARILISNLLLRRRRGPRE